MTAGDKWQYTWSLPLCEEHNLLAFNRKEAFARMVGALVSKGQIAVALHCPHRVNPT